MSTLSCLVVLILIATFYTIIVIIISTFQIAENSEEATVVGIFIVDAAERNDTTFRETHLMFTFSLIDTAQGRFRVHGNQLMVNSLLRIDILPSIVTFVQITLLLHQHSRPRACFTCDVCVTRNLFFNSFFSTLRHALFITNILDLWVPSCLSL